MKIQFGKNVRNGKSVFSTRDGETCFKFDVKFLNSYDKIYYIEPRNDFIEMVAYSLIPHCVKLILLGFFCGLVLKGLVIMLNWFSFLTFFKKISLGKYFAILY